MSYSPVVFALNSSRRFGERVIRHADLTLAPHEEREFEDGEHKARPLMSVRGRDVFVIQSLYWDTKQSVNDKLCRLLFFIGSLKDACAARVTAIVPYLSYSRKDVKTQARDPVTTRYVASLFEAVGTDQIVTMDVHNLAAYQNSFRCRTDNLEAFSVFVEHFVPLLQNEEAVVVSPDAGGLKRSERFRQSLSLALGRPVGAAFAEKHRSQEVVSGELLVGEVRQKTAIIVDDIISTGTTIARTVKACHSLGADKIHAVATHGLFVGDANAALSDESLTSVAITDTVPPFRITEAAVTRKLAVLDSAPLFAEAIRRIHGGGSIAELMRLS